MRTASQSSWVLQYPLRAGEAQRGHHDRRYTGASDGASPDVHRAQLRRVCEGSRAMRKALCATTAPRVCEESRQDEALREVFVCGLPRSHGMQRVLQSPLLESAEVSAGSPTYIGAGVRTDLCDARQVPSMSRGSNDAKRGFSSLSRLLFGSRPRNRTASRVALQQLQSGVRVLESRPRNCVVGVRHRVRENSDVAYPTPSGRLAMRRPVSPVNGLSEFRPSLRKPRIARGASP
jgi:hypothetical protein